MATATFRHGVRFSELDTAVRAVVSADAGVSFVVGSAPVHKVPGGTQNVNKVVMAYSLAEAVSALGYDDDWQRYTLCEHIRATFQNATVAPVFFNNVYDPMQDAVEHPAANMLIANGQIVLEHADIVFDSVEVRTAVEVGAEPAEPTELASYGRDYIMSYNREGYLVITLLAGGMLGATSANVAFATANPLGVTEDQIIGGYDVATDTYTGLEKVDTIFSYFRITPNILCAPGWSDRPAVSAVMAAKCVDVNGVFPARAAIDAPTNTVRAYSQVPAWKNANGLSDPNVDVLWPMVGLGDRIYHGSTIHAVAQATVDATNSNIPFESPSNKRVPMDRAILADGSPIFLTLRTANYLNSQGIVTFINFIGGWRLWGNRTSAYPANSDPKDMFIPVKRMMHYVGMTAILTSWQFVDRPITRRLVEMVTDTLQLWLNHLTARGALLGGRITFPRALNPDGELINGHITFAVNITPPAPAEDIEFLLSYDLTYLQTLFQEAA